MSEILIAYFSASGITEKVAQKLAKQVHGDLFKIEPKQPYTNEDLDWTNSRSRSSLEMEDQNARPEIKNKADNMEQYETIFIGFPIWWYREPSIIDTFIESYDLTNKTIIPFATSGSSGMGKSSQYIQKLAKGSNVLPGKRFDPDVSDETLNNWTRSLIKQ